MNRRWTTLFLTGLACAVAAQAQTSSTSGAVRGVIKSKAGQAQAGAAVQLRNLDTGLTRTAVTNAQGEYQIGLLPVGSYQLTITAQGMRAVHDANIRVALGQSTVANFNLDKAEAAATVEITATPQTLDTTQVNTMVAIDEKLVQNVPLKGRNFTDLMKLTPGAVTGATGREVVDGARGIMNNLTIDGASFNSNFYGDPRGGTAIPFSFGLDTIKELQVITDAYDAQYAGAGAVINAVTKQGSNEFSGDIQDQFRSQSLVAKLRPVPYDPRGTTNSDKSRTLAFSQQQFSANVGGPIIKDKLFYFVGVESEHYSTNLTPAFGVSASGNNSVANLDTFLTNFGAIPVGNDGHTLASESGQSITNDQKNIAVFARLDWNINDNNRASLRLNTQQYTNTNGTNLGATTGLSANGEDKVSSISWVAELVSTIGANMTNEARLQVADERHPRTANSSVPEFTVGGGFTAGQIWYAPSQLNEFNKQILDTLTWSQGDWLVKGGADLQWFSFNNQFPQYMGGFFSFPDYATANAWATGTLTAGSRVTYKGAVSPTGGWVNYDSSLFAWFAQGQYQGLLNHRLNLTAGVRVTRENQPNNPLSNAQFAGTDQANSTTATDPRVGFSLDLFGDGKTVVKGGWGRFSSPNPSLTVSNTMTANGNTISVYAITPGTSAAALTAWNSGALSYATRTQNGTALTALDLANLTTLGGVARTGQIWDPANKLPQKTSTSLGVDHKFDNGLTFGVRGEYAHFDHQQYFVNVNLRQLNADGSVNPSGYYNDGYPTSVNRFSNATASRPGFAIIDGRRVDFTGYGDVFLSKNDGTGYYHALTLTASRYSESGFGFQSSATWSKAMDINSNERITNNGGGGGSVTNNPAAPFANMAPSDSDARFRGVFTGYFPVVYGIQGAVTYQYQTGLPYSAMASGDLNGDGVSYNDYAPGYGGRNAYRQPSQRYFDLALKRAWQFAHRLQVEGGVQVFNVFNWANQTTSQTTANASLGYIDTLDRAPREVQFSLRLKF